MFKPNKEQITSFLLDEGISDWREKDDRGELLINSPFVSDSKKKCGINWKKGVWNCYKSGQGGNIWSFVKRIKDLQSENEARLWFLKNYFSNEDIKESLSHQEDRRETSYKLLFPKGTRRIESNDHEYISYLKSRYFNEEMIRDLSIHINEEERRVVFPIYNFGKLSFYARRAIDSTNPIRWLNSTGEGSDPVWNIDRVRDEIWIFEGIFDAVRMYPKGVAIFGAHIRDGQVKKILDKSPHKIVVVCDGDAPGRKSQFETASKLSQLHPNVWIHLWKPGAKDFGEMKEIKPDLLRFDTKGRLLFVLNENTNFPGNIQ